MAVKLIKPGMDTKEVIARFDAERQALAMMEHPNIAHVLDAGATAGGRPFFVMEQVEGCESALRALGEPPYAEHRERLGRRKWQILGAIARSDPQQLGLAPERDLPDPAACWERELARWEEVIDAVSGNLCRCTGYVKIIEAALAASQKMQE